MTPSAFVTTLASVRLPSVFNPYADCCDVHDRRDATRVRRENLEAFLDGALTNRVTTIWIARDLGYRGGRRTGVPLTDEIHLDFVGRLLSGVQLKRATLGPIMAERTAAIVWSVLMRIEQPVLLWNVFPFHPHEPSDPFSNRAHTEVERKLARPLLETLIDMFQPERLVAIGRDAQLALAGVDIPLITVRHPSYGGQKEFTTALYHLYDIEDDDGTQQLALLD